MIALVQVRLPYRTLRPRDVSIMSWWFTDNGTPGVSSEAQRTEMKAAVLQWWKSPVSGTDTPQGYISSAVDRALAVLRVYSLTTGGGLQFHEEAAMNLDPWPSGTNQWPLGAETACVLTAVGDGTDPIRNRRGRIYIGPLTAACMTTTLSETQLPGFYSGFINLLAAQSTQMVSRGVSAPCRWAVYSRSMGKAYPVLSGRVNNEVDTQRRRGLNPTAWTPFGL